MSLGFYRVFDLEIEMSDYDEIPDWYESEKVRQVCLDSDSDVDKTAIMDDSSSEEEEEEVKKVPPKFSEF